MGRSVMRQTPLRSFVIPFVLFSFACARPEPVPLCDLNEIQTDYGVGKVRLVDGKPEPYWVEPTGEPRMIPCDCADADPLRPLEHADPLKDAARALELLPPPIYGEEGLTHVPPGWKDGDSEVFDQTNWEPYPWSNDAYPICWEFERLQPIAREYYARYNRAVLDSLRDR